MEETQNYEIPNFGKEIIYRISGHEKEKNFGLIKSLGSTAICIKSAKDIEPGANIQVVFEIPGKHQKITAIGNVVQTKKEEKNKTICHYEITLRFLEIEETCKKTLEDFIAKKVLEKAQAETSEEDTAKRKVMIIDHELDTLKQLKNALNKEFSLLTFDDCVLALNAAKEKQPDIIFVDMESKNLDGMSVLLLLKSEPDTKNIPVVMTSSVKRDDQTSLIKTEGALGMIKKPFNLTMLPIFINQILDKISLRVNS